MRNGTSWPKADFNGAAHEHLLGLPSATAPRDDDDREEWWWEPPKPELLRERFARVVPMPLIWTVPALVSFRTSIRSKAPTTKEIAALLIDAPGAQTLRNNADLFMKHGGAPALSRAMCSPRERE